MNVKEKVRNVNTASQAGGREFESRFPLLKTSKLHFQ